MRVDLSDGVGERALSACGRGKAVLLLRGAAVVEVGLEGLRGVGKVAEPSLCEVELGMEREETRRRRSLPQHFRSNSRSVLDEVAPPKSTESGAKSLERSACGAEELMSTDEQMVCSKVRSREDSRACECQIARAGSYPFSAAVRHQVQQEFAAPFVVQHTIRRTA